MHETENTIKEPTVTVRIVPGQGTPNQRRLWARFCQRVFCEVLKEESPSSQAPAKDALTGGGEGSDSHESG